MLIRLLLFALVIAAVTLGVWWYQQVREAGPAVVQPQTASRPEPLPPRYPVPASRLAVPDEIDIDAGVELPMVVAPPLPALEISDGPLLEALSDMVDVDTMETWLVDERLIERSVVVINSLDGPPVPLRLRPLRHVPGLPGIRRDAMQWSPDNAGRYQPLMDALRATDPAAAADLYFRYYPLFQQAYAELGMTERHFNDRLVDIIDHLLATPAAPADFEVTRDQVLYQFADERLENESWGRKILLRIGPEHAAEVKSWLRALREQVTEGDAT